MQRALKSVVLASIAVLTSIATPAPSQPAPPLDLHPVVSGFPNITAQPQNQTVIAGQTATFTVTATGDAPSGYQWIFNGLNVGSSSSAYTRANCQLADNDGRVQVTVSNDRGSVQSSPATLTVIPAGKTYYVATNGLSTNTGLSTNSTWPLQYGINQLIAGNTLKVLPGLYTNAYTAYGIAGNSSSPITIQAQSKWTAVLGNSTNRGIDVWKSGGSPQYIILDGLCISNAYSAGIKLQDGYCTVRNCWIVRNGNITDNSGIDDSGPDATNSLIEYNLVEFNGSGAGFGHGMYIGGRSNIVRGNVVRNNLGYGIQLYSGHNGSWPNQNQVYNNLTYGQTNRYGVTIWGTDGTHAVSGTNYVYNNTVLDGMVFSYGTLNATNNIILPARIAPTVPIATFAPAPVIHADYNLGTNTISPAGAHDVITNYVGLVNRAAGLDWLKADSPARGHAFSTVCGPEDFFGNAQSSVIDIGAFQYSVVLAGDIRVLDPSPANPDFWLTP